MPTLCLRLRGMKNQKHGEKVQAVKVGSVVVKIYTRTLWEVASLRSKWCSTEGTDSHLG